MFPALAIGVAFVGMFVVGGYLGPFVMEKKQAEFVKVQTINDQLEHYLTHSPSAKSLVEVLRTRLQNQIATTKRWIWFDNGVQFITLLCGLYCVSAGIYLLSGWVDPFAAVDGQELGKVAARGGGRSGIFILAIRFWPWVLIGLGGFFAWATAGVLKQLAFRRNRTPA